MRTSTDDGAPTPRSLYTLPARVVSLLAAGAFSLVMTFYPQALIGESGAPAHAALLLSMWGIGAGFVHGVGFVPRHALLQLLLGPIAAWLLMPLAAVWLAAGQP